MAYSLLPIDDSEIPKVTDVYLRSFSDNGVVKSFFRPEAPKDAEFNWTLNSFLDWVGHPRYGEAFTKLAEDSSGEIIGFIGWQRPYTMTQEEKAERNAKDEAKTDRPWPEGANGSLIRTFFQKVGAEKEKWFNPEKMFYLDIIAILPEYQRKGLGTMLINHHMHEADEAGLDTFIGASPAGLQLYQKLGFEEVDSFDIDTRPYGGDGTEKSIWMIRKAKAP